MQLRVKLDRQLRNVCPIFRVLRLLQRLWPFTPPDLSWTPVDRLDSLDAPAPCAWTPLKLVLLNVLDPVTKPWESRLSLRFEAGTI